MKQKIRNKQLLITSVVTLKNNRASLVVELPDLFEGIVKKG